MVESVLLPEDSIRIPSDRIAEFITAVFIAKGLLQEHARQCTDVLVSADLLGIRSHGVARLPKFIGLLEKCIINTRPQIAFQRKSDTTGILDADNGPGIVASQQAMEHALSMAETHGSGFVAVCNTNHFGFPGYYARRAAGRGFIGICMSNGGRVVTPTFSVEPFMGSNPISVAIPGGPEALDFYLDMSTASVARGKIETYLREGKAIPENWVPEGFGDLRLDDGGILTFDVPLLPLGGDGPEGGGHKGYALSLMVELLCSLLVGQSNPATGHFLGAIKLESFRCPGLVYAQIAEIFNKIRSLKKAAGQEKIYIPGELEAMAEKENRRLGLPIAPAVLEQIRRLDVELKLGFDF